MQKEEDDVDRATLERSIVANMYVATSPPSLR